MAGPWERYAGGAQVVPADPLKRQGAVLDNRQTEVQTAKTVVDTRKTQQEMRIEAEKLKLAQQAQALEKIKAAQAAEQTRRERGEKLIPFNQLNAQLRKVWDLYAAGPGKTQGVAGILDYLPTQHNAQLDAATAGLGDMARGAFRVAGSGPTSDKDAEALVAANQPSRWEFDSKFTGKLQNLETRLAEAYKALGVPYQPYRPKALQPRKPAAKQQPKNRVIDFNDLP